jgi:hypothetical protein
MAAALLLTHPGLMAGRTRSGRCHRSPAIPLADDNRTRRLVPDLRGGPRYADASQPRSPRHLATYRRARRLPARPGHCDLIVPQELAGGRCPRCRDQLFRRVPFSMTRVSALVAAGYLLYPVANYFPMSVDYQFGSVQDHTIASGVSELLGAGL